MDAPIHTYVHPFVYLVFRPDAQRHVGSKYILLVSLHKGDSQTSEDERHQPPGSSVVPACAVGPEVVLEDEAHIHQGIAEGVGFPIQVGIIGLHLVVRAFQLAQPQVEPQILVGIEVVSSHDGCHRLLVGKDIAVQVAFVGNQSHAGTNLQTILVIVLCPHHLQRQEEQDQQQQAFTQVSPHVYTLRDMNMIDSRGSYSKMVWSLIQASLLKRPFHTLPFLTTQ